MAYITFFLPARVNERFDNFKRYFESLMDNISDLSNIEVVVKFDDDQDITNALQVVKEFQDKGMSIKHMQTPRGSGYQDISYFYSQLMDIADENSYMFMAGSIDLRFVQKNFDKIFIEESQKYEDKIFVIHPSAVRSLKDSVRDINNSIQLVECFPVWSRRWIEIIGAYGYNSSNDGYAGMVEYLLFSEYGLDRRINLSPYGRIFQQTDDAELVVSSHWQGPRRRAMESHLNRQNIAFARQAAKNLALNISNAWNKKGFSNYLIQTCLDVSDKVLILSNYK